MDGDSDAPVAGYRATITDVAREAGVSVATVSKVVNERYGVAPATIDRVRDVVAKLGYESSLIASSLRRQRTHVIGILVADFEPFSTQLLMGIARGARGTGYELLAYSAPFGEEQPVGWERRSLSRLAGTLIDGAIIVTPTMLSPHASIPVVAIDPHAGHGGPTLVDTDNVTAAREATEHLINLGHRRIAHVRGRSDLASSQLREEGYLLALKKAGIPADTALIRDGEYQYEAAAEAARELLQSENPPDAVFAANDRSAIAVLDVARELGLTVPGDLSVIGFDDIPEAAHTVPPLTTMAQPLGDMGALALQLLLDLLNGRKAEHHTRLQAKLVMRASTGPARRS